MSAIETPPKTAKKPVSLKTHKLDRANRILNYFDQCINLGDKIDKAFLKELGEIA